MTFRCGHPKNVENTYEFGRENKTRCRACHRDRERKRRGPPPPRLTEEERRTHLLTNPFRCGHPLGDNVRIYHSDGRLCRKCRICVKLQAPQRKGSPRNQREDSPLDRALETAGRCGCGLLLPCNDCVAPLYHFATARRAA